MLAYGAVSPDGDTMSRKLQMTELAEKTQGKLFTINEATQKVSS